MEQQNDSTGEPVKPATMKRSTRMLHESSFATSAFASSRSQSRPPGFIASSLDYKSSATDPGVTTKPGRDKKNNSKKQQQEQAERERQYQQQRQYRSGHPTRAQGNFGPPPHSVRSLEDLENMTEEQIYKLFMDDPELHQAFIKATAKEQKGNTVPTSAPVGAQNAGSSSRRKTSSSKSKRSSSTKNLKQEDAEREVPYFQWLFLLFLFGAALYKIHKAFSSPTSTKELRNRTGKKQKKKQGGTGKKSSTKKTVVQDKPKVNLHREETKTVEKKPSPPPARKKKKKKPPKTRSTTPSSSSSNDKNESVPVQEEDRQPKQEIESTDASNGNTEPEIPKIDPVVQAESDMTAALAMSANDDEWQTVTKSSKADKKAKAAEPKQPVEEKKILEEPVVEKKILEEPVADKHEKSNVIVESKKESTEKPAEVSDSPPKKTEEAPASDDNVAQPASAKTAETVAVAKEEKKSSDVKTSEKPKVASKGEPAATTDDDAALALQLHKQEVNLARAVIANPQEEEWAEVTVKKKKGNK